MGNEKIPRIEPAAIERIAMRDGVRLYTEIHFPTSPGPWPLVLLRTPYPDPTFPWSSRPIAPMLDGGYAVAVQACRGTWKSEGRFRFLHNEGNDGFDTIEWLAAQPWCSGKIGMIGSSYSGTAQWLAAMQNPPHLTCIAPQSPAGHFFYETPLMGGVFVKGHMLTWPKLVYCESFDEMGVAWGSGDPFPAQQMLFAPNRDAIRNNLRADFAAMLEEMLAHPTYDAFWESITLTPAKARNIDIPVFTITGFHDADQTGALYDWEIIEQARPERAGDRHLLVGPWRHHQMHTGKAEPMGRVQFGADANVDFPRLIRDFFDVHLKTEHARQAPARCRLYTSGSNAWREFDAYPPRESVPTKFFAHAGALARSVPGCSEAADTLVSDYERPAPLVNVGEDCSEASRRDDVLTYTTESLAADVTVLGPVTASIHLVADAPDADVFVRLEDVWPDGTSVNMTGEMGAGPFRARYREGFEREVPLAVGVPARLDFHVCHMGHTFRRSHRLRISVAATAASLFEPNHHTGDPLLTATQRRKATLTILRDAAHPTHFTLPILGGPA
jgi:putative CocE/NonD family hydrolase